MLSSMSQLGFSLTRPLPRQRSSRVRGFTILEVAIATAIMTLALGTALITLARGFDSMDTARCLSYSSQIMQSELEKMRLTSWGNGTTAGTGTTGVTAYQTTPTNIGIDPNWANVGDVSSRMTMTRVASDVHTGMIQVTFTISWTTHDGHPMSRSYTTYYGKNGLYDYFSI
jgi:Tfp pilus assembly protein PilV